MKLEKQVCSLDLSKKLKELGFTQESLFYWCERLNSPIVDLRPRKDLWGEIYVGEQYKEEISAYTVAELGEMLPEFYYSYHCRKSYATGSIQGSTHWECCVDDENSPPYTKADTEADARANMLIHLKENNLI